MVKMTPLWAFFIVVFISQATSAMKFHEESPLLPQPGELEETEEQRSYCRKKFFLPLILMGNAVLIGTGAYLYYTQYHESLDYYSQHFNVSNDVNIPGTLLCSNIRPCEPWYKSWSPFSDRLPLESAQTIITKIKNSHVLSPQLSEELMAHLQVTIDDINNAVAELGHKALGLKGYHEQYCFLDSQVKCEIQIYDELPSKGNSGGPRKNINIAPYSPQCMAHPGLSFVIVIGVIVFYNCLTIYCMLG